LLLQACLDLFEAGLGPGFISQAYQVLLACRAATLPPDIADTFKMAPRVSPIFPAEGDFEVDVATPDARKQLETLTAQSKELATLVQKVATETAEPVKESVSKVFKKVA
jgi:hypothetical protein